MLIACSISHLVISLITSDTQCGSCFYRKRSKKFAESARANITHLN